MKQENISSTVKAFLAVKEPAKFPEHRYASFDYCYNYFHRLRNAVADPENLEKSCLVLGYYLASWGMLRGSSFLSQEKSIKHYQKLIEYIGECDKSDWDIDLDSYTEENIKKIIKIYNDVREKFVPDDKSPVTLVSKILLGVFGFSPAFDQNFNETFRLLSKDHRLLKDYCGFRRFNEKALLCIKEFYENNDKEINRLSSDIHTVEFATGEKSDIVYPKAKIVDMYGFQKGLNAAKKAKQKTLLPL